MNPHFKALEAAYQLHYYLCLKTHYLKPLLIKPAAKSLVHAVVDDVCDKERYHLLETNIADEHLRLLLSLKPDQHIARAAKMLKGNLDREFSLTLTDELERNGVRKLWARGYFARTSGKINLEKAREYIDSQSAHHGYRGKWIAGMNFQNPAFKSPAFSLAHSFSILSYHVVMVIQNRIPLFDECIAPELFKYIMKVGEKHGFALERMGLLPDHLHLIVEARPGCEH